MSAHHSTLEADLRTHLGGFKRLRELHPGMSPQTTLNEWVLDHGRFFTERRRLPKRQIKPKSRECYYNAWKRWRLGDDPTLRYCEGFLAVDDCPIPVLHGWCLNLHGEVEDPSVANERAAVYCGVVFTDVFATATWAKLIPMNAIGILGNAWQLDLSMDDLLKGVDREHQQHPIAV